MCAFYMAVLHTSSVHFCIWMAWIQNHRKCLFSDCQSESESSAGLSQHPVALERTRAGSRTEKQHHTGYRHWDRDSGCPNHPLWRWCKGWQAAGMTQKTYQHRKAMRFQFLLLKCLVSNRVRLGEQLPVRQSCNEASRPCSTAGWGTSWPRLLYVTDHRTLVLTLQG